MLRFGVHFQTFWSTIRCLERQCSVFRPFFGLLNGNVPSFEAFFEAFGAFLAWLAGCFSAFKLGGNAPFYPY